jgi:rubrerythrin
MFTIADIRNIAIQIERNGEATYRKAANQASDPELAEVFMRMADDEMRHAEWFENIQTDRELTAEQSELEAVGKSILREMVKDKTFSLEEKTLAKVDNLTDLISESQGFEEDTILFYEMLSGFIEDPHTQEQLNRIIAEEKKHSEALQELLGSAAAQA